MVGKTAWKHLFVCVQHVLETSDLSLASVAQKMFWASNRKTTRKEDMAYCLLGLFDINMPLLYGEGEKAFLRLQEHIAATSTDHSLFAWSVPSEGAVEPMCDRIEVSSHAHLPILATVEN